MQSADELLTAAEVAAIFKVRSQTIYRWGKDGTLETVTVGGTVRFRKSSVDRLLGAPQDAA